MIFTFTVYQKENKNNTWEILTMLENTSSHLVTFIKVHLHFYFISYCYHYNSWDLLSCYLQFYNNSKVSFTPYMSVLYISPYQNMQFSRLFSHLNTFTIYLLSEPASWISIIGTRREKNMYTFGKGWAHENYLAYSFHTLKKKKNASGQKHNREASWCCMKLDCHSPNVL